MSIADAARHAFSRLERLSGGGLIGAFEDYVHTEEVSPGVRLFSISLTTSYKRRGDKSFDNVKGESTFIFLGRGALIPAGLRANGARNAFFLGENCDLTDAFVSATGDENAVFIGAGTTMGKRATITVRGPGGTIAVGERCRIAEGAMLANTDAHGIYDRTTGRRLNYDRPVTIDCDVTIGRMALIGKGVTIGHGTTVEDGAVVSRSVPARSRVGEGAASQRSVALPTLTPRNYAAFAAPIRPPHAREANLSDALEAMSAIASGHTVDPAERYTAFPHGSGVGLFLCERAAFDPKLVEDQGEANAILLGSGAKPNSLCVTFDGSDNILFFGPGSRAAGLTITIRGNGNRVYVGSDTTVVSATIPITGDGHTVSIGERCMLSSHVALGDPLNDRSGGVVIGDHVWVGRFATLRAGTRVGAGAMIGQGAVASGPLDASCVHAGIPAVKRREGIVWDRHNCDTLAEALAFEEARRDAKRASEEHRAVNAAKRADLARVKAERENSRLARAAEQRAKIEAAERARAERAAQQRAKVEDAERAKVAREEERRLKLELSERARAETRAKREAAERAKAERDARNREKREAAE